MLRDVLSGFDLVPLSAQTLCVVWWWPSHRSHFVDE